MTQIMNVEEPTSEAFSQEPREGAQYGYGRPRLGGLEHPVEFTEQQTAVLNAIADTMIPPEGGFPAPSEVDIVGFIGRYVTPVHHRISYYPEVRERDFAERLDQLGADFVAADVDGRTAVLTSLQAQDEEFFEKLRGLVYYGYYATAEVTQAIRKNIPAGRDYKGPPQPYGYIDCIEDWDEEIYGTRGRGSYLETDEVKRVDLGPVEWVTRRANEGKA